MPEKYSVIIPAFNSADYISECLDSVSAQTYPAFETIVIDDGSSDNTVAIAQAHALAPTIIHTQRKGGAGARNAGAAIAIGDCLAFLDSDDTWLPAHLERVDHLLHESKACAVLNQFDHLNDKTGDVTTRQAFFPVNSPRNDLVASDYFAWLSTPIFVGMSAFTLRRDVFNAVNGLDETMLRRHDIELWLRVLSGRQWAFDPVPSSVYRYNRDGNLSSNKANAAYYLLQALVKSEPLFEGAVIRPWIQRAAVSALTRALTDGTVGDFNKVWPLSKPYLTWWQLGCFSGAKHAKPLFAMANRIRRKIVGV